MILPGIRSGIGCLRSVSHLLFRGSASCITICHAGTDAVSDGAKLRAWSGQLGIDVPKRKIIPKNAVLEALKDAVPIDWTANSSHPLEALDHVPHTVTAKMQSFEVIKRAKESVELITDTSELLNKGMVWGGEVKAHMDYIELSSADDAKGETDDVSEGIDDMFSSNTLQKLYGFYQRLIANNAEIPMEWKEKILAYACFKVNRLIRPLDTEETQALNGIIQLSAPMSKSMLLSVICCFAMKGKVAESEIYFQKFLDDGHKLDSKSVSRVLSSVAFEESYLKPKLLEMCSSEEFYPSASCIFALFPYQKASQLDTGGIAELLSRYINEANQCCANTELEVLVEALRVTATKFPTKPSLMFALLNRMDAHKHEKVDDSAGFVKAMFVANMSNNLDLAKKVFHTGCRHSANLSIKFFYTYILCMSKQPAVDTFIENAAGLMGRIMPVNNQVFKDLTTMCQRRGWPHVLPLIFSVYDNPVQNHKEYVPWLRCAANLVDKADEDCLFQFKAICDVLVDYLLSKRAKSTSDFRLALVDLMVKCDHAEGLKLFSGLPHRHPFIKKERSYSLCKVYLANNKK